MTIKISLNEVKNALVARNIVIAEIIKIANGVQIKLTNKKAVITCYTNGNSIVQGRDAGEIEDILNSVKPSATYDYDATTTITSPVSSNNNCAETKDFNNCVVSASSAPAPPPLANPKVFIVHGHNKDVLEELQIFLFRSNYTPIVLAEERDGGDTIIERLERVFCGDIFAAIVLATPDDMYNNDTIARCRSNVDLELGFVIARLSRRKLVLLKSKVDDTVNFVLPSDSHS